MNMNLALQAQSKALEAIKRLHGIIMLDADWNKEENFKFRGAVGLSIGRIKVELPGFVCKNYPEIDDLADINL